MSKVQSPKSTAAKYTTLDFEPWTLDLELPKGKLHYLELGSFGVRLIILDMENDSIANFKARCRDVKRL